MSVPHDSRGYAIDERLGVVHTRHADHAAGLRRTTVGGLHAVLGNLRPIPCLDCYPAVAELTGCPICGRHHMPGSFIEQQHQARLVDTDGGS